MKNEVAGLFGDVITLMNGSGLPTVAVDIPSGLNSDTGQPLGVAIRAEMTVALGYPKLGEVIYPGLTFVGELVVVDIGIDRRALVEVAPQIELLDRETVALAGAAAPGGYAQGNLRSRAGGRRRARKNRRGDFIVPRGNAHRRRPGDPRRRRGR